MHNPPKLQFEYLVIWYDDDDCTIDYTTFVTHENPWQHYRKNFHRENHRIPQMFSGEPIYEYH